MKIFIGKYRNWIGPYQLADILQKVGFSEDFCYNLGEKLSKTWLSPLCEWIDSKRLRKVKVKIHNYDLWGVDCTLSYIILPLLKEFRKDMKGAPNTDDEDVPEELRSTSAPPKENDWDTDELHFKRWDWIIDEMIWTFEQIHPDNDWESQYHSGTKDTHVFDKEGYQKHQDKIENGLRLFGKYYQGLWN